MANEVVPLKLLDCNLTTRCEEVFESQETTGVIILDFVKGTSLQSHLTEQGGGLIPKTQVLSWCR